MLWFILGVFVGGVLGMIILALIAAAKQEDEYLKNGDDAPVECFWRGERMMKTNKGLYICPVCGWRYRGRGEE